MIKDELIDFEEEIKALFLEKKIRCPIHLSGGNEDTLIEIFKSVKPEDWVLSTHRSHYHALLKGIPAEWLKSEILAGRSMQIMNPEYRFFSSSIVAGNLPIAVGIALAIKTKGEDRRVYCFNGDMAAETGAFHEAVKYAAGHQLPVTFVVEDNGFSTDTPTAEVWGISPRILRLEINYLDAQPIIAPNDFFIKEYWGEVEVIRYNYSRTFPHVGCGTFVHF